MSRRWGVLLVAIVAAVAVVGVAAWWLNRPDPVPSRLPAAAPAVGSCWQVEPAAATRAFPWSGAASCSGPHTAEVYYVGQADHDLVRQSRGTGDNAKIAANLMQVEVRRACGAFASTYLGANWHQSRVTILADWIGTQRDGFFGCALAETPDAAGTHFSARTASLRSAGDGLAAACTLDGTYTPCDQPHNGEFVGTYTVTPADAGAQRPDLTAGYVGPTTAQTWLGSDQTFACYAVSGDRMRGTVRSLGTRPLPR